jgi:hypothetical protein
MGLYDLADLGYYVAGPALALLKTVVSRDNCNGIRIRMLERFLALDFDAGKCRVSWGVQQESNNAFSV